MLRVIGDLHGIVSKQPHRPYLAPQAYGRTYLSLIKEVQFSIQVGDVGWREDVEPLRNGVVDPALHKVILGNHDDYDNPIPQSLGDFGITRHGHVTFGFIRGEESIDKRYRQYMGPQKTWWHQEEFDFQQADCAVAFFEGRELDLMITHGAPSFLFTEGLLTNPGKGITPSKTAKLLTRIHEVCKIKNHIFGHHHHNYQKTLRGTNFTCLNELCFVDIDDKGNIGPIT